MTDLKITEEDSKEINKKLIESLENYRKTIYYMYGDAPVEVLCLPKVTETVLINNGILRVYDLFNRDLTEIKGIGDRRIADLASSLDKFLSMS